MGLQQANPKVGYASAVAVVGKDALLARVVVVLSNLVGDGFGAALADSESPTMFATDERVEVRVKDAADKADARRTDDGREVEPARDGGNAALLPVESLCCPDAERGVCEAVPAGCARGVGDLEPMSARSWWRSDGVRMGESDESSSGSNQSCAVGTPCAPAPGPDTTALLPPVGASRRRIVRKSAVARPTATEASGWHS